MESKSRMQRIRDSAVVRYAEFIARSPVTRYAVLGSTAGFLAELGSDYLNGTHTTASLAALGALAGGVWGMNKLLERMPRQDAYPTDIE